eukprot:3429206-Ditylum_brightwellii.AAC.1
MEVVGNRGGMTWMEKQQVISLVIMLHYLPTEILQLQGELRMMKVALIQAMHVCSHISIAQLQQQHPLAPKNIP